MAGLRFADLQSRPIEFLDFTSLTFDEFQQLPDLDPSVARAMAPISGTLLNTASRMCEQMTTRVVA
jgi:hypothetical protein